MRRTFKASGFRWFTSNFSIVSSYITCLLAHVSKHHNHCNFHLKSESITGQPTSKLVVMRKLSLGRFFYNKKKSVCKDCSRTLLANNVYEDCSYINAASAELSLCMLSSPGWVFPTHCTKKIGYGWKNSF